MSTQTVYIDHHKEGNRLGNSIMKDKRGELLCQIIGKDKKVLDIGCRDGVLTSYYVEGNSVVGVDIDKEALQYAKEKLQIETVTFDLTDEWPLGQDIFDVVVAGEVLEHLYFPKKIISRVAQVLSKEGLFVGSVPNAFSLKNRIRLFLGNKKSTPLHDPTHINHFKRSELKEILEMYFVDVEITPLGRFVWLEKFWPGMFSFDLFFKARGVKK